MGRTKNQEPRTANVQLKTQNLQLTTLCLLLLLLTGCAGAAGRAEPQARLSAVQATGGGVEGFARADRPREFVFPRDHGPHPQYATEWWYYTGNLDSADGRHYGYQLTFFRYGLAPEGPRRASAWGATSLYMAHLALTDVAGGKFYAFERFSRGAAGLAGATGEPAFRVWLDDWSASGAGPQALPMRLSAADGPVAIDLTLDSRRAVVLQGPGGVSQKSATPGNASYYYSFTRMETSGTITIDGQATAVQGQSWLDREFGTSALEPGALGWDWFAVQLADGGELMYAQVRGEGGRPLFRLGKLIQPDGGTRQLEGEEVLLETLGSWTSQRSGATYPSGWRLRVPGEQLDLRLTPYLEDQELTLAVVYWEGAVRVEGSVAGRPVRGNAYVELTGYDEQGGLSVR